MLLAAGRGERLRPLTDRCPKPLVEVGGRTLVEHAIARLAAAGIRDLVINHAWLGELLVARLADGRALGVDIRWSAEPPGALEVGGGIRRALPLLGDGPFVTVNADVWCDFDFRDLPAAPPRQAHLVMVDNPAHVPAGDFALVDGELRNEGAPRLTFSGIGLYRPDFFAGDWPARVPLRPLLDRAVAAGEVTGQRHGGAWHDAGTPERLEALRQYLATRPDRG